MQKASKFIDHRYSMLKKILYEPIKQSTSGSINTTTSSSSSSDSSTNKNDNQVVENEMIERQYYLLKLEQKHALINRYKKLYNRMHSACKALEKYPYLLNGTRGTERFSKQLRIPTVGPSKLGWDYNMDRNK